ncbi:MAG: DUF3500 domain-containing protein [Saprospiraceae bacterium]|nr:DUF3500 domain-containing protein [Saprospiraceae bacterium]
MKYVTLLAIILAAFQIQAQQSEDPAVRFLSALSDAQRASIMLPFDHDLRDDWHFLPGAMVQRPGLMLGQLSPEQEVQFLELLRASLSASGYTKTMQIMSLELVLIEMGQDADFRDPGKYHVEFYGNPETDSIWAWSFEGHHVALHFTHIGDQVSMAPRFFGANPATVPAGSRQGERTLAEEQDLGFALLNALTEEQRSMAIFRQQALPDIVTANESQVKPFDPVGIPARDMTSGQRQLLEQLLQAYLSAMPEALANSRMAALRTESFDDIRFGWAGATEPGKPHYYRIQGKSFVVEYDNIQSGANHIHTVWRDFDGDFGRDLLREHYRTYHDK